MQPHFQIKRFYYTVYARQTHADKFKFSQNISSRKQIRLLTINFKSKIYAYCGRKSETNNKMLYYILKVNVLSMKLTATDANTIFWIYRPIKAMLL